MLCQWSRGEGRGRSPLAESSSASGVWPAHLWPQIGAFVDAGAWWGRQRGQGGGAGGDDLWVWPSGGELARLTMSAAVLQVADLLEVAVWCLVWEAEPAANWLRAKPTWPCLWRPRGTWQIALQAEPN